MFDEVNMKTKSGKTINFKRSGDDWVISDGSKQTLVSEWVFQAILALGQVIP